MPTPDNFEMEPSEKQGVGIDYSVTGSLPTSATVSSGTVAAINLADGTDASSILSSTTATTTTSTTAIYVTAPASSNGNRYSITFTTTISDGSIFKEDIYLTIRDKRRVA